MLTSWKRICLRNDLLLEKLKYLWGGELIFFLYIKIKIKYPAGKNLEIITFRYLKTLVFDKVFKILQHYLILLFLKSIFSDN